MEQYSITVMEQRYSFTLEDFPLEVHLTKTHEGIILDIYHAETAELVDTAIYPNEGE